MMRPVVRSIACLLVGLVAIGLAGQAPRAAAWQSPVAAVQTVNVAPMSSPAPATSTLSTTATPSLPAQASSSAPTATPAMGAAVTSAPAVAVPAPAAQPATSTQTTTTTQPAAPTPGFSLKVEPAQAHIGDVITITLVSADPAFKPDQVESITFEPDKEKWQVDSQWRRELPKPSDARPAAWRATLRPFDTGELSVPAATVIYRTVDGERAQAETTTATLKVNPIRPPDAELTLLGLRDPLAVPRNYAWLWVLAAATALTALLAWLAVAWWRRRKRSPLAAPAGPVLPPGLWALRELNRRGNLPACQNGPAKVIFSHVSEVIRLYLDRRYGIQAIDMTTLECLRSLEALRLSSEVLRWIREFLEECDMVKFTTVEPARERWRTIWHDARLIVKMTTPPEELGLEGAEEQAFRREVAV